MENLTEQRRAVLSFAGICAVITALRLFFASSLELAPDEAYYWLWSRHLLLAYPDHPPMVAYLIRLGTAVDSDTELGVRLCFALSTVPSMLLTFVLAMQLGLTAGWATTAASIATLLPIVSAGSLIATPDTPLGLAWLLCTLSLVRLQKQDRPASWWDYFALAASVALGLWSKHSALLCIGVVIVAMVRQPPGRQVRAGLCVLLGAITALPTWRADLSSQSSAAANQLGHLLGRWQSDADSGAFVVLARYGELIGGQIALATPLIALLALGCAVRCWRQRHVQLLVASYLVPLGATALSALSTHPEQNWASLGHPGIVILACLSAREGWSRPNTKRLWWGAVSMAILAAVVIHVHALWPFLPLPPLRDPVSRLHGWNGLRDEIAPPKGNAGVLCDNYGLGAQLAWQWRDLHPEVPIAWEDRSCRPLAGSPRLLLDEVDDPGHSRLHVIPAQAQGQLLELRRRDGRVVRQIQMWVIP
ncbi:MAG: glycosyltransferase family 39 protein [Myxococcota bacterium]|jgi:4-amino-4-deoxy-L-arabinose transferase-like glycosyltransferase|nr:glycosyltransferase family 39 protein [Myxococcota bacterium]